MTLTKLALAAATALMLATTPASASANDSTNERRDPFEAMSNPKNLLRGAMLTDAQVAQIRELRKTQLEHAKVLKAKEKALYDRFDDKFASGETIDTAELTALIKAGEQLSDQGENEKLEVMFQMRALLTPDQLRRVSETHQKMKALNDQLKAFPPTVASESAQ